MVQMGARTKAQSEGGLMHYLVLVYFGFFFWSPIRHHAGLAEWGWTALGTILFLALYLSVLRLKNPAWQLAAVGVMVLTGALFTPLNPGADCFFIFAGSLLPHVLKSRAGVMRATLVILAVIAAETWALHLSMFFLGFAGVGTAFTAIVSYQVHSLKKASEEIEHLAKVAERERIARDLHDVLGHTLSSIILKSELAGKLVDCDPERARREIREVEETSRAALAEVRSTIRGYRVHNLQSELAQAKATLETAGVVLNADCREARLSPAQESVVALVLREAVTNVVRHAQAKYCSVCLEPAGDHCRLEIKDDGCGGPQTEGHGLHGMRERIEALGGTLERDTTAGTRLKIEFPLHSGKEAVKA